MKTAYLFVLIFLLSALVMAAPPPGYEPQSEFEDSKSIDNDTYINANKILMFVTNHGNFGRDLAGIFGNDFGTYYPYVSNQEIMNSNLDMSVLYAAGLWMGGLVNSEIRVAIAEYSDEYVSGPMAGGTYQPDNPDFRVYKLYKDSLESNPNIDYLQWPVDQGAPVDESGNPQIIGDQMLWAVFNDADPLQHDNRSGETAPLGIEVQQTVWAEDQDGSITIPLSYTIPVYHYGYSDVGVEVDIVDGSAFTGDDYMVVIDSVVGYGAVWNLINTTTSVELLTNQTNFSGDDSSPVVDGLRIRVIVPEGISWNWSGSTRPFTSVDWGGSGFFGGIGLGYEFFGSSFDFISPFNVEVRWIEDGTGQNGYCYRRDQGYTYDGLFPQNLTVWDVTSSPERQINFAFVEFYDPSNTSGQDADSIWNPGEQYDINGFRDSLAGREYFFILDSDYSPSEIPAYAQDQALFNDFGNFDCLIGGWVRHRYGDGKPDPGDIWRINAQIGNPGIPDTFTFTPSYEQATSGPEGISIYIKYKLYNKGGNTIDDFYISLWSDSDLGQASDDLVGCDTLDDIFFCYNGEPIDNKYGVYPPAVGFKVLEGPTVPSPGSTAVFDGNHIPGYKNLGLTAFIKYINGTDPDDYEETYNYMQGLNRDGTPLPNGTKYAVPGDPVTGVGDIDSDPSDCRMMGNFGPMTFNPGDSQYVLIKLAVGQGLDYLSSITVLKEVLNFEPPPSPTELIAAIRPDPQYGLFMFALDPLMDTIFITRQGSDPVGDIDYSSLLINGSMVPESVTLLPSHPDFNGEVLALVIPAKEFIMGYGLPWGINEVTYSVSGAFSDETPLLLNGSTIIIGHIPGDINGDGNGPNVADLTFLVDYLFLGGPHPPVMVTADLDCNRSINVSELTLLVDHLFKGGPAPVACP
ncbi:MAG: hypothetical protein KOO62_07065 [candidate division Zixibacteria bacterium]|nr:hypothetical protein [candidate division Zixibacteria bacterium]